MQVHYLQHVPFEGIGSMADWFERHGDTVTATHLYRGDELPAVSALDWLVVMGGPMSVHDVARHPWLAAEKRFVREAIDAGKTVLGICLGAQLIAEVLGGAVRSNGCREIGWFPLRRTSAAVDTVLTGVLPEVVDVFHWHGERFIPPAQAQIVASSDACLNQGFVVDDRVVALQFHLETTPQSAAALIDHCADELDGSRYVQSAEQILGDPERFATVNRIMDALLSALRNRRS